MNYDGSHSDYTFVKNDDGSVTVGSANGTDTLIDVEGLWFNDEGEWYSVDYAVEAYEDADAG